MHTSTTRKADWLSDELAQRLMHPDEHVREAAQAEAQQLAQDIYDCTFANRVSRRITYWHLDAPIVEETLGEAVVNLERCLSMSRQQIIKLAVAWANSMAKEIDQKVTTWGVIEYAESRVGFFQCSYETAFALMRSALESLGSWDRAENAVDARLRIGGTKEPPRRRKLSRPPTLTSERHKPAIRAHVFPNRILVCKEIFHSPDPDTAIRRTYANKVFERYPTHALEQRWAVYVNLDRLEESVLIKRQLPRLSIVGHEMHWISKMGSTQWDDRSRDQPELYLFRFTLNLNIGSEAFAPWKAQSESDQTPVIWSGLDFFYQAAPPVLPWPGVCVRALGMPKALPAAITEGVQQAEDAIIEALGMRCPAITTLLA